MDEYEQYMENWRRGYHVFDTDDFSLSPQAIALVNQVLDYIEKNPERWNQGTYGNGYSDTNCFAGLVIRLSQPKGENRYGYGAHAAMNLLGIGDPWYRYWDRFEFVSEWKMREWLWGIEGAPTVEGLRQRVSIAFHHDFRKKNNTNDDTPNAEMDFNDRVHNQIG